MAKRTEEEVKSRRTEIEFSDTPQNEAWSSQVFQRFWPFSSSAKRPMPGPRLQSEDEQAHSQETVWKTSESDIQHDGQSSETDLEHDPSTSSHFQTTAQSGHTISEHRFSLTFVKVSEEFWGRNISHYLQFAGLIPGRSGGRISFSRDNFLC